MEVTRATDFATNTIETINDNFHNANLIQECLPRSLPNIKDLETKWQETSTTKEEVIN